MTAPAALVRGVRLALGGLALAVFPAGADLPDAEPSTDFLRRPLPFQYTNYGEELYRPYRRQIRLAQRYDHLGNFLAEGFLVYEVDEQRPGSSRIRKDPLYRSLNNLVISYDSFGPWNWALTIGDEVRTEITPLTFRQAGFNGLRWDLVFPGNKITLMTSRGFDAEDFPTLRTFSSPLPDFLTLTAEFIEEEEVNPVMNFVGHWETRVGDFLRFGTTLVNQHQVNAGRSGEGGFLRGSIPYPEMQTPHEIAVRVRDDSPETESAGAVVYGVFIDVEGVGEEGEEGASSDPDSPLFDPALTPQVVGGRRGDGFLEVRGDEVVEFFFPVPESFSPRGVTVRAVVANDYRIELAQEHKFFSVLDDRFEPRRTPYRTVSRAPGEVADFSNRDAVRFEHSLSTGQTLYGFDFRAQFVGLEVTGEYERNLLYRRFPVLGGRGETGRAGAWYVTALRDLAFLELGGELFRLDPEYGGGYDSRRGGILLYTDKAGKAEDIGILSEFPIVDDNDDDDRYADDNRLDYPSGSETESGVFPGLDKDHDNIPDDDRNANGVPDFEEPFLLYGSDPQEFVYGVDLNNNGVIDERENDDKPDYPYDRDRKGGHLFLALPNWKGMSGAAGLYRQEQIAGPGRADSRYLRAAWRFDVPRWARIELNHDSKRVWDTIPDPVFVFRPGENNNPDRPPSPDRLDMADSWVHTSFAGTRLTRFASLHVENNLQWVLNRQFDRNDRLQTLTMVNKADWTWSRGPAVVRPMFKHLLKHVARDRRRRAVESWNQVVPILRIDVNLTESTSIQFGQQGIGIPFTDVVAPLLAARRTDRVDRSRQLESVDSVLMFTVKGNYQGYDIVSNTGFQRRHEEYADPAVARTRDGGLSRFFISLIAGYDR